MKDEDRFISLVQACRTLGLNAQTMRTRICKGQQTPFRICKHPITGGLVVLESEIDSYKQRLLTDYRADREVKS